MNGYLWFPRHSVSGIHLGNEWSRLLTTRCVDPLTLGWPGSHGVERCAPPAAPGACGGPCFCMVFAFLAWPCTGRPKHTAIRSPICAMCFLSTVGARPCFVHTPGTTDTVLHLLGGLEGTGGLSIVGVITRTAQTLTPNWVIVHAVDNEQVQPLLNTGDFALSCVNAIYMVSSVVCATNQCTASAKTDW